MFVKVKPRPGIPARIAMLETSKLTFPVKFSIGNPIVIGSDAEPSIL
jgi:hypothetical protein